MEGNDARIKDDPHAEETIRRSHDRPADHDAEGTP
tara:strand:+ start:13757 stop:13861 length:105 start_codon:yes stop_codon:yes gene_type:complete